MGDHVMDDLSDLATTVGIADLSNRSRVLVAGPDAPKLLNNLCTNDVVKMTDDAWCEAFFLNVKGGVLFYARLFKQADAIELDLEPGFAPAIIKHIDRYIIREKATLRDLSGATPFIHFCGRAAEERIQRKRASDAAFDERFIVRRIDRTPFPGFDVVWRTKGENLGILECPGDGLSADQMERLRVLAGLPAFGREITEGCLAQEIDRIPQTISFTKGCYIGQETVARLDALGHTNKALRGVTLPGVERPTDGAKIRFNDKVVGVVASSALSLDGRSVKCLAVLRNVAGKPGTEVFVEFADDARNGIVSTFPFAD